MSTLTLTQKFDNIIAEIRAERQRINELAKSKAQQARDEMAETAPRSNIEAPGYVHFSDRFYVDQIAEFNYGIFNDKVVNGYELWKLLEFGTRKMSPRKTIGPIMDRIGPQFLEEVGRFGAQ